MSKKTGSYVYAYLRSSSSEHGEAGTPYYIGKGTHGRGYYARAFDTKHNINIPSDKNNVVILADTLQDNDSRQAEMLLIYLHGRIDTGTGCLRNLTDGGEGCAGRVVTEKTRAKISKSNMGKKGTPWTEERRIEASVRMSGKNNPFFGKTHSEETIKKIVDAHVGRSPSPESIARGIASRAVSPNYWEGVRSGAEKRKGRIVSEETGRKISEATTGRKLTSESKEKMRAAKLGKPQTPQHISKVSEAIKLSWDERRQKFGPTGRKPAGLTKGI